MARAAGGAAPIPASQPRREYARGMVLERPRPIRLFRLVPVAVAAVLLVARTPRDEAAATPLPCGSAGRPPCPLQRWMRKQVAVPYAKRDLSGLAAALNTLAQNNPNPRRWANWTKFAEKGAASAAAGREDTVSFCTRCHRAYRRTYKATARTREPPRPERRPRDSASERSRPRGTARRLARGNGGWSS